MRFQRARRQSFIPSGCLFRCPVAVTCTGSFPVPLPSALHIVTLRVQDVADVLVGEVIPEYFGVEFLTSFVMFMSANWSG